MRALRLAMIAALIACSCSYASPQPKGSSRQVIYSYNQSGLINIVIVQETVAGAKINISVVGASNTAILQKDVYVSRAEFEKIWSTLNAPGVEKRPYSGSEYEVEGYYIFKDGKRMYSVKKASSARAVSALASRLRNHVDAAIKSGTMKPVPVPPG